MPQRVANVLTLVLGIAGLAVVAALVLAGADLRRAARTGPRWKRALVAAGLALLTWAAPASAPPEPCYFRPPPIRPEMFDPAKRPVAMLELALPLVEKLAKADRLPPDPTKALLDAMERAAAALDRDDVLRRLSPDERKKAADLKLRATARIKALRARLFLETHPLEHTGTWVELTEAWRDVEALAEAGRHTTAQRKRATEKLRAAENALTILAASGRITQAELDLLRVELQRHVEAIYRTPPTDTRIACYTMPALSPPRRSLDRLARRLPLLRQMAEAGTVKPPVVERALAGIRADLEVLTDGKQLAELGDGRRQAEKVRDEVAEQLARIQHLVSAMTLADTQAWQDITAAWRQAEEAAKAPDVAPETRKAASGKLSAALQTIAKLTEAGMLTEAEADVLAADAGRVRGDLHRFPPMRDPAGPCYGPCYIVGSMPARAGFYRMLRQLPLLAKLVASGRINPTVAAKVLPLIRADVAVLDDKAKLAKLPAREQQEAVETREKARELLGQVDKLLSAAR